MAPGDRVLLGRNIPPLREALGGLGTEGGRVELAGQGHQDAASRPVVEARVPAAEPVEQPAASKSGDLPVQQGVRPLEVAQDGDAAEGAIGVGVEQPAGVEGDQEQLGPLGDRFKPEVVVDA